ncbi:unnamed protein product [Thelazia callipaeda]|uniref:Ac45-VOA1_TM domain-containing protein n=1 Tax=Thelazia callipaeda TaxID=103827 RepID=A0A0N5D1E8_THECL|nr:unnamed protein product [Thelazia callipaeda]
MAASLKTLTIGINDFTLPKFNSYVVRAYDADNSAGPFASVIRIFPHSKILSVDNPLVISSGDHTQKRVRNIKVDTFGDLLNIFKKEEFFNDYEAVIISSSNAFEEKLIRNKRVSSDVTFDEEPGVDEVIESRKQSGSQSHLSTLDRYDLPVILPPLDSSPINSSCLLYMEAFDILIPNSRSLTVDSESKNKYSYDPFHYSCNTKNNEGTASFLVDVEIGEKIEDLKKEFFLPRGTVISFKLDFVRSRNGYWFLDGTTLMKTFKVVHENDKRDLTIQSGTARNQVDVGAAFNHNFACHQTGAAVFNTSDGDLQHIGIILRNFEISLGLIGPEIKFGYHTSDCIGTFSAGTWMGIIISVVLSSVLLFGYLMVQSIQTMDRFDDPKQKQIVINFKE